MISKDSLNKSSRQAGRGEDQAVGLGGVMFAELEAFAVEDGVPAVAAADGIEAAVQVPAAVGVGVKEFVLAFVGFEVVHADAGEADGHAAREQFAEQVFCGGEQFALVVGWFGEAHGLVRRKLIHIADAQADGAGLLALCAQRRADALTEILDQAAEKFSERIGSTLRE